MNSLETIPGRTTPPNGKRPKQHPGGRACLHEGCITRLSVYNKDDKCYLHKPRRRPRVRGSDAPIRKPKCSSCSARARGRLHEVIEIELDGIVHREGSDGATTLCEGSPTSEAS